MPQIIGIVALQVANLVIAVGGIGTPAWLVTAVAGLTYAGIVVGLGFAAHQIFKPPSLSFDNAQKLRSSAEPAPFRRICYGNFRTGGNLVFYHTNSTPGARNNLLHMVIAIASHEIEAIDEVYFGEELLVLDDDGYALNDLYNAGSKDKYLLYLPPDETYASTTFGIDINGTSFSITTSGNSLQVMSELLDAIKADAGYLDGDYVARLVGPPLAGIELEGKFIGIGYSVQNPVTLSVQDGGVAAALGQVPTGLSGSVPFVRVKKHLGAWNQAADADLIAESEGKWTSAHRLRGTAYVYLRFQFHPSFSEAQWARGLPVFSKNVSFTIRGRKVWDPRDGAQSASDAATWTYSNNAALCLLDYLRGVPVRDSTGSLQRLYGLGATDEWIDSAGTFTTAANLADESVALAAGGSESRYTVNGSFQTNVRPMDLVDAISNAQAGALIWAGGKWRVKPGAHTASVMSLTVDHLRGKLDVKPRLPRRDLFNATKGVFSDPANGYQPAEFPAVTNSTYESEDNSERIYQSIDLPFTTSSAAAQRVAKILLEKSRQQISITLPCNLSVLHVTAGETVDVTLDVLGWSGKLFDVVEWRLLAEEDENGVPRPGIDLVLRETASTVYDWSAEETVLDPAPDTNFPTGISVEVPGVPTITEELYQTTTGVGTRAKAVLSWAASPDAFVRFYDVQYRESGDTDWIGSSTPETNYEILDLAPGSWDFRIRARNFLGSYSDWVEIDAVYFAGLTAAPSAPANLRLETQNGTGLLTWDALSDLDVLIGGKVIFRHSPETSGVSWINGAPLAVVAPGTATQAVVPLRTGTYFAKALDSTGNQSEAASAVVTTIPDVLGYNAVVTKTWDPTFAGTHSSTFAHEDGYLTLAGQDLWDDRTDNMDDWGDIDTLGGVATSGTFTPTDNQVDLGGVFTSRITATVKASFTAVLDTIDARTANIDDWTDFDGDDPSDGSVVLEFRSTEDDPAGSPTWSAWMPFTDGDYTGRAFEFRAQLTSVDEDHTVQVTQLRVSVDMPDRTESAADVTCPAAGLAVSYANAFYQSPAVGVTMQDAETGDYYKLTGKTAAGFTVRCYDSSDTGIERQIDWTAKGYGKKEA